VTFPTDGGPTTTVVLPEISGYPMRDSSVSAQFTPDELVVAYTKSGAVAQLVSYDLSGALGTPPVPAVTDLQHSYSAPQVATSSTRAYVTIEGGFNGRPHSGPDVRDGDHYGVFLRRFCNSADSECRCPSGTTDLDGDGVADECDPCTNPSGAYDATGRISISTVYRYEIGFDPEHDNWVRLELDGSVDASLASLPILEEGMHVRIESASGVAATEWDVPAGAPASRGEAGWRLSASSWTYRDRTDHPVNGLSSVKLKQRSDGSARFKLKARAGEYGADRGDAPLHAIVTFGRPGEGVRSCLEMNASLEQCPVDEQYEIGCTVR
jgi:hypothetical protein